MLANSGIYQIFNWANGKSYVGSATYLRKRINDHKCSLKKNIHSNNYLQSAWNKYNESNFQFIILEYCEKDKLIEREQYWINKLSSYENGYNLARLAGNTIGVKWSNTTRAKQIAVKTGKKRSQEEKDKISLGMKGKKNRLGTRHSEITRIRMKEAKANKTEEMSDNQAAAQRNLEKWPCLEGSRCKCEKCKILKLEIARQYRLKWKNKEISPWQ